MRFKKIFLIVFVFLVIAVSGIIASFHFNGKLDKSKKCGMRAPGRETVDGITYRSDYCNRFCIKDSDCRFSCGCGAINKGESCDVGDIMFDCIGIKVKCAVGFCIDTGKEIP